VGDRALRHYHELGPSERAEIDADIGCRGDATEQIVTAQIIRRLRDLDMPLEEIRAVLDASDVEIRNRVIANHLGRLETNLARTETAARELRDLLDGPLASPEI
jgi:DNA-binding transcriptional MerR regulator